MKLSKKLLALGVATSVFAAGAAYAATQSVGVNIAFDTALQLTNPTPINFGTVQALTAGTYVINTANVVTPSGGGVVIGGTPASGIVNIRGSGTQTVAIHTGTYVASNGVTLSAASCLYNGVTTADCDTGVTGAAAPGAGGRDLTLGVTATVSGVQAAGTSATPSFTVTVVYG